MATERGAAMEAVALLEAMTDPGVDVEDFRTARMGLFTPQGLFESIFQHFVEDMPAEAERLLPHALDRFGLSRDDEGVPVATVAGDDGDRVLRGDEAVAYAGQRQMRVVHALEILLYCSGKIAYDGAMETSSLTTRWTQIVGAVTYQHRLLTQWCALQAYRSPDLLSQAQAVTTTKTNPIFEMVRLESVDPRQCSRFQRLLVMLLREMRRTMGGLRKSDGKLYRAKRVPRHRRARYADGTLKCAHPGCAGYEAAHCFVNAAGKRYAPMACCERPDHVWEPVYETVSDELYSTKAFVTIDTHDPWEGPSPYQSPTIACFIQHHTDRIRNYAGWLDLTSSPGNLRNLVEYFDACYDVEIPSLAAERNDMLLSFRNGAYDLEKDRFYPYWCSKRADDREACDACRAGDGAPCLAEEFQRAPGVAGMFFDQWLDWAAIAATDATKPNLVCRRCQQPSHRHRDVVCQRTEGCDKSFALRCVACGAWETAKGMPPPCACWKPRRYDAHRAAQNIPTPYCDALLLFQQFTMRPGKAPGTMEYDKKEEREVIDWIYAMLGRLRYKNDGKWDRWQVALMIIGQAATGKSTVADFIQSSFPESEVGIMAARTERDFGASAMLTKENNTYRFRHLVLAPEMSSDERSLDQSMWQSMVSGGASRERVTVAIKNETAATIMATCQIMMLGNTRIAYADPAGQFSRRIIETTFARPIPAANKDALLGSRLVHEELPFFLVKANRMYRWAFEATGGHAGTLWGQCPFDDERTGARRPNLPRYFSDAKERVSAESSAMKQFMKTPALIFTGECRDEPYISEHVFRTMFNAFCRATRGGKLEKWDMKNFEAAFRERKVQIRTEERAWPPHSGPVRRMVFVVGVSVATDHHDFVHSETGCGWFERTKPSAEGKAEEEEDTRSSDVARFAARMAQAVEETSTAVHANIFLELLDVTTRRGGVIPKRVAHKIMSASADCEIFNEFEEWKKNCDDATPKKES